jgi:hypothetical protein
LALLKPLESNEQNLIKLDAVFRALKIENEDDIKIMAQFFLDQTHTSNHQQQLFVSSGVGPDTEVNRSNRTANNDTNITIDYST